MFYKNPYRLLPDSALTSFLNNSEFTKMASVIISSRAIRDIIEPSEILKLASIKNSTIPSPYPTVKTIKYVTELGLYNPVQADWKVSE